MSQIKTLNGVQYTLPQYSDTGWGVNTGNVLTQYLAAIADVTLQLSGGAFTLTAETDFGGSFGLKALYIKTETANPASAGVLRLAKTDSIGWRNNANGADKLLNIDGSDNLQYASTKILLSGAVVNADINSAAAIAYSKLNLTGSIVNADINASAAIVYSKLSLSASIVNADINASAAIAYSKLNLSGSVVNADIATAAAIALTKLASTTAYYWYAANSSGVLTPLAVTASKAVATDANGLPTASAVTATELGYVSGVTSAIQTQINAIASHVFQIVTATGTTTTTTSNTSMTQTVVTASITPSSSSHKVLVIASATIIANSPATINVVGVMRGSTDLTNGGLGYLQAAPGGAQLTSIRQNATVAWLDSPATTSATAYYMGVANSSGSSVGLGSNTVGSWSIILVEVA